MVNRIAMFPMCLTPAPATQKLEDRQFASSIKASPDSQRRMERDLNGLKKFRQEKLIFYPQVLRDCIHLDWGLGYINICTVKTFPHLAESWVKRPTELKDTPKLFCPEVYRCWTSFKYQGINFSSYNQVEMNGDCLPVPSQKTMTPWLVVECF